MTNILTAIIFPFIPVLFGIMDTLDDKWMFYDKSFYRHFAKFLTKIKVFSSEEKAAFWFNNTGQSWRNAYINGIKDPSLPNSNKIMWSLLGIRFAKPAPLVDAWHWFKGLLIVCICVIVAINLPIWFVFYYTFITRIIYFFTLTLIWFVLFETTYNNK